MKFTVTKADFEKAITPVSVIAQSKTAESNLHGIYIEATEGTVMLYCYDIEKGIKTNVDAFVAGEGTIIADSQIVQIVHSMPDGEITFSTDDNYIITLTSGDAVFQIMGRDAKSYPSLPDVRGIKEFALTKKQVKSIIGKTIFSACKEDANPVLKGSCFDIADNMLTVSAIDGFRCAVRKEKNSVDSPDLNVSFILPGKAQQSILRIMDDSDDEVKIELCAKHLVMIMDNLFMIFRLIEGDFPKYEKYIPEYNTTADVDRDMLITSLERVAIINDKMKSSAKLSFDNDILRISCETENGKINDVIPVHMEGEPKDILFNQTFLLEALKCCENEKVQLRLAENGRATVITATDEDRNEDSSYIYLIMPVRGR